MERQTVDFGIDLGTTNSVIARATSRGVKVIENRHENRLTPSAVAVMGEQYLVGQDALNKPELSPATQFKRLMGTTNLVRMADGSEMTPEQLSAHVLKELKAAVQLRYDMQIEHVVITVPAMFQQPQCEATHRAAELAGLNAVTLLQEPIAAAIAYLNEEPDNKGNYLVYDLGGGTFDVSIVRLQDGEMTVLAHGGDNYLGGVDFDRKLYEWALNKMDKQFPLPPQLQQSPLRDRLLRECAEAKKRLSQQETTFIDLSGLGLPIAQLPITQEEMERAMDADTTRTLNFVQERLDKAKLKPQDIRSILLIGGSTKSPYIRRRLKEEFGIPLTIADIDPMTVVALGAAIHASTMLKPDRGSVNKTLGAREAVLKIHYDPVVQEREADVSGQIVAPANFTGELRIARSAGDWDTGWIPLRNGSFLCDVRLGKADVTDFTLSLRDLSGAAWTLTPSEISIRCGIAAAQPIVPYNYGVALQDGAFGLIVAEGNTVPAFGTATFSSATPLAAGSADQYFVYFLEGRSLSAEDNLVVGKLAIKGQDLPRTLKQGERIDISIHMDESRRIKAKVSIPLLDKHYDVEFMSSLEEPPLEDLWQSIMEVKNSVQVVGDAASTEDQETILRSARELEHTEAEYEHLRKNKSGDSQRVVSGLSRLKSDMHRLTRKYELTTAYQQTMYAIDTAEEMAENANDMLGKAIAADLRREAERAFKDSDLNQLKSVDKRAWEIYWKHYSKTDEYWIDLVNYLRRNREAAEDGHAYHEYLKRAEDCLLRVDYEGVRVNAIQAMQYLPDSEEKQTRFPHNIFDEK